LNTYKGTPDEKIIACDGIFYASQIHIANDTSKCYVEFNEIDDLYGDYNHGRYDAISAISTLKGIAKKANFHSLAIDIIYNKIL